MHQRSKGTLVFAVVAVVSLGSTIASSGFGRGARGRFDDARAKLEAECGGTCPRVGQSPPSGFPEYRLGWKELGAPTATNLVRVLERADEIDRSRTLASSLLAAKLFDGVAEKVDADPALLDDPRLVSAIRRSVFASSRKPLEAERLAALSALAGMPSLIPIRTAGVAESTTTQAMTDVSAALREMEDSALSGDIEACEKASQKPRGLAKQVTVGPSICKSAHRVVESGRRLEQLRLRASSHARHVNAKTARVSVTR